MTRSVEKAGRQSAHRIWRHVRDQLGHAASAGLRKVEVHVRAVSLELLEQLLGGGAQNFVDFVDLVELIRARKERKEADDLEEYAANAPDIHLIVVVPVCQQALGGAIPPRRDVFCVRLFAVDAAAGAEVRELEHVLCDQNVLLRSAEAQS